MAYLLLLFTMYILVGEYLCENIYRILMKIQTLYFILLVIRQDKQKEDAA